MKTTLLICLLSVSVLLFSAGVSAVDLSGSLKNASGGFDPATLASGSASNAAGIISFCVKNNYLGSDAGGTMKERLMGKIGLAEQEPESDSGYLDGLKGLLKTGDGESVDLSRFGDMKKSLTRKACAAVLNNAKSLL